MEISIPWATMGSTPADGDYIGFDLHVNDDDGGGTRDAKIAWEDGTDNAWQWPSVLGTLQIAGCANPLPVEMIAFTAERQEQSVELSWSTASEYNNDRFVIERSVNLEEWEKIGEVAGSGNTIEINNYTYTDQEVPDGVVYYRLQQIDYDGASAHSHVVSVMPADQHISIVPNPFTNAFDIMGGLPANTNVIIHDVSGKLWHSQTTTNTISTLTIQPDLPTGLYIITLQLGSSEERLKIIKK